MEELLPNEPSLWQQWQVGAAFHSGAFTLWRERPRSAEI